MSRDRLAGYVAGQLAYRAAQLVALLLTVSTLLFVLLRLSADPAVVLAGEGASPAQVRAVAQAYGLDQPLWQQYTTYLVNLTRLDLNYSLSSYPSRVTTLIVGALPWTIALLR